MNPIYLAIISLLAGVILGIIIGIWFHKKEEEIYDDYEYRE